MNALIEEWPEGKNRPYDREVNNFETGACMPPMLEEGTHTLDLYRFGR